MWCVYKCSEKPFMDLGYSMLLCYAFEMADDIVDHLGY